jgi:type IV pilus assembly protein PilY1
MIMKRNFKKTTLALSMLPLLYIHPAGASDVEVYKSAVGGSTTLVLMLDTSGSMGSGSVANDYSGVNCGGSNQPAFQSDTGGETAYSYSRTYCAVSYSATSGSLYQKYKTQCTDLGGTSGLRCYDRVARLKDAMFKILNTDTIKINATKLGLGHFSGSGDGRSGRILVPAVELGPLGSVQRNTIKTAVSKLTASAGTPSIHAYAEAAAYLLGTKTVGATSNTADSGFASAGKVGDGTSFTYAGTTKIKKTDGLTYQSPLPTTNKDCSGQGIYFLTDGEPNNSGETRAKAIANDALTSTYAMTTSTCVGLPIVYTKDSNNNNVNLGAWNCMGDLAKRLNDKTLNPSAVSIKTAVVGFGSVFSAATKISLTNPANKKKRDYYDCTLITDSDGKNACNWGEKSGGLTASNAVYKPAIGGYGEGGFYSASSVSEVVDSLTSFIDDLEQIIPPLPTGSVVIPKDTFDPSKLQPYGYVSLVEPNPSSTNLIWAGNVKKYNIASGTVKGGDSENVFTDRNGSLSTTTYDLWAESNTEDGGKTQKNGVYDRLPLPESGSTKTRNVYVDIGSTLVKIPQTVSAINALSGLTSIQKLSLINYLGYKVDVPVTEALAATALTGLTLPASPTTAYATLGGTLHSTPVLVTASGNLDSTGNLTDSSRNDYVLFGSMEGALHVVDATSYASDTVNGGVEKFAFVPFLLLSNAPTALVSGSTGSTLSYGVDGPWSVYTEYTSSDNKVKAKTIKAYGGLRMGGNAYYGINLSDPDKPSLLFKVTSTTSGFSRLGQTWGKPTIARIRYNNQVKRVVIVGGGYDSQYEDPAFNSSGSATTLGNAVYILDAENGALLWSASAGSSNAGSLSYTQNQDMKYSLTGRINAVDRDADGLVDHLYFSDLGGQVFRADLNNRSQLKASNTSLFGTRVVRLASLATTGGVRPRFYEAPAVTIHDESTQRFAVVSVGSGDRSSPLNKTAFANGVYAVLDRDVARTDLYSITDDKLYTVNKTIAAFKSAPTSADQTAMIADMTTDTAPTTQDVAGWYYQLSTITDGYKAFDDPIAINGDLYATVFNPNISTVSNSCSASISGESSVYRFCLPYGRCSDIGSNPDGYFKFKIGSGIQSVSLGSDPDQPETRRLIFNQPDVTTTSGTSSGESGKLRRFSTPRQLIPTRWYEKLPK